jgi:hypothetical protein
VRQVAKPYWTDPEERRDAWLRLAGVVALTLGSTGAPRRRAARGPGGVRLSPMSAAVS